MLNLLKSIWHFLFHFNPAEDIEWDARTYDIEEDWDKSIHKLCPYGNKDCPICNKNGK